MSLAEGETETESVRLVLGQAASLLPPLDPCLCSTETHVCTWMWPLLTICNVANSFSFLALLISVWGWGSLKQIE